jgi:hypothetical protein
MTLTPSSLDPNVEPCPPPAYDVSSEQGPAHLGPSSGWDFVLDYKLALRLTADNVQCSNDTGQLFRRKSSEQQALTKNWKTEGFQAVPALVRTHPPFSTDRFRELWISFDRFGASAQATSH